jgi:hypothetical protein
MSSVKFVHLRNHETDPSGDTPSIHVTPWGGCTIGFVESDPDKDGNRHIVYTMAKCNPVDNFSKKIGRTICKNRLEGEFSVSAIKVPSNVGYRDLREILAQKYYEDQEDFWPGVRKYIY